MTYYKVIYCNHLGELATYASRVVYARSRQHAVELTFEGVRATFGRGFLPVRAEVYAW